RADCDVREVPRRVRRVEQRDVVTPSAPAKCVERRPYFFLRPHVTTPPPRLSRLDLTPSRPASPHAVSCSDIGHRSQKPVIDGFRILPTSCQPSPISRPATGSPTRVHISHSGRHGPRGIPNSSPDTVPRGLTTRTSSRNVARGSST